MDVLDLDLDNKNAIGQFRQRVPHQNNTLTRKGQTPEAQSTRKVGHYLVLRNVYDNSDTTTYSSMQSNSHNIICLNFISFVIYILFYSEKTRLI